VNPRPFIPFNCPYISAASFEAVRAVLESGRLGGDGPVCREVERRLEKLFGISHVLLTTSGTHALETAMLLCRLKPGDEVILPSFTFVSTANAVLRCGAKPVFCDIEPETFTMDPADLARRITPRTRVIAPVHYAGVAARMDEILDIAKSHNCLVVEDAAQGVNATYKGKFQGTIGDAGAFSFHETKNYVAGEGGALVTGNEELARRAEIIREKGTNRANFLRGEVDKYTWVDIGSSYVVSDLLAALLRTQLDDLDTIQKARRRIHERYIEGLAGLEQQGYCRLPVIPGYSTSNYHLFPILLPSEQARNLVIRKMKEAGIGTTFHYVPLHSSPFAVNNLGTGNLHLPVTDRVSGTLVRLPIYPGLTDGEVSTVIDALHLILGK
jgi:dTDP-4-amino-4,6-dideoxygalactose transaminase